MPYGPGHWCYDCGFSHTADRCMSNPANAEEWENHPQRLVDGKPRKPKEIITGNVLPADITAQLERMSSMSYDPFINLCATEGSSSMYQIYLVIKENMKDEVSSMLISGHDDLNSAAEQCLVDFQRLQDANEMSARVDKCFVGLMEAAESVGMDLNDLLNYIREYIEVMDARWPRDLPKPESA